MSLVWCYHYVSNFVLPSGRPKRVNTKTTETKILVRFNQIETKNTKPKLSVYFWEIKWVLEVGHNPFWEKKFIKRLLLVKKWYKLINYSSMELFFELYFFQFFGPLGIMYFLVRCSVSVYLDLTEPKRTKPKLPKHKNFGCPLVLPTQFLADTLC